MLIFLASFINSINNCSITIIRCHLTNGRMIPTYTYVFNIQNFTTVTVTDIVFETNMGLNLIILIATQNTNATFTNCTFNKISGFRGSHNTSIHIKNSSITNCRNTMLAMEFIEISYGS